MLRRGRAEEVCIRGVGMKIYKDGMKERRSMTRHTRVQRTYTSIVAFVAQASVNIGW
jgi:hypothetical protein